jgi:ATP-grasp domain/L-amino acid ligase C-terminal domain 2/ATP-grasp N-terminal domain
VSAPAASAAGRPLLLIGGASLPAGRDCLVQARARGVDVWLADTAENLARTPELPAMAAAVVELPYRDPAACVAWATAAAPPGGFLGVYGFRELAVESVAAVAEALGLPGNSPRAIAGIRDKARSRATLTAAGFRQPSSALCSGVADARAFLDGLGGRPCVVKPVDGKGSSGVTLVRSPDDLPRAMARLDEARAELTAELRAQGMAAGAATGARPVFLAEEFQNGAEYSAEGVFVGGRPRLLAVTAKRTSGPPTFVELAHAMPADLAPEVVARVRATLDAALPALGLRFGVFHVEFWVDGDDVVLGEAHARPGGDYIHVMTQHVTDVELHGVVVDELLSRQPTAAWRVKRGAAIRFVTPPPGVVKSVDGWAEIKSDPHVIEAHLALEPGGVVPPLRSSADRSSFVVTTAPTGAAALAAADRLVGALVVDVAPG